VVDLASKLAPKIKDKRRKKKKWHGRRGKGFKWVFWEGRESESS
jgi:hypothetical protein